MLVARMILELQGPLHCGGGEDSLQDQPVCRDAFGYWQVPGSSVAGLLRDLVAKKHGPEMEKRLFGFHQGNDGTASLVWCSDAELLDYDGQTVSGKILAGKKVEIPRGPFIRDHVRLDFARGSAAESGKFDEEIIPPGARFALELMLDDRGTGLAGDDQGTGLVGDDEQVFLDLCAALASGQVFLGGKVGSGYGRVKAVQAECRRFEMGCEAGILCWLNLKNGPMFADGDGEPVPLPAPDNIAHGQGLDFGLTVPLETRGPIIVGGSDPDSADDADITCLVTPHFDYDHKKTRPRRTLPGSSFKGALRHRVFAVAQALGLDAHARVASLFGSRADVGTTGKVSIADVYLDAGTQKVQHVSIDRFTGGAMPGALFDEAPVWQEGLCFDLEINGSGLDALDGLLLCHALMDLATASLPVGNGGNRGNGFLRVRDLDKGWKIALAGVACKAAWDDELLDRSNTAMLQRWLARMEEARP